MEDSPKELFMSLGSHIFVPNDPSSEQPHSPLQSLRMSHQLLLPDLYKNLRQQVMNNLLQSYVHLDLISFVYFS